MKTGRGEDVSVKTVGVMMPADMGGGIAMRLADAGIRTISSLAGRSARTRDLAAAAGVEDVGSDIQLVMQSDVILSVVSPEAAEPLAARMAHAIRAADKPVAYVDCNAVSPETAIRIAETVTGAGGRFTDGGIIGPPPRDPARADTRLYLSGPDAPFLVEALGQALDVRLAGPNVGDASAVKMCYAALTKGSFALMTQLAVAAERLGVSDVLRAEFAASQRDQYARMRGQVPGSVPKAFRWVAEMREIAATFESVGVTGSSLHGAAETYDAVAATALGAMRVEEWADAGLSFEDVVSRLAGEDGLPAFDRGGSDV